MPSIFSKIKDGIKNLSYQRKILLTCLTVSILPLTITTVFCYFQISNSLLKEEKNALNYTLQTAADSLDSQITLYENLLSHVAMSEIVINTASREYNTIYDKYEQFTYSYDVFINNIYTQYRDVKHITLYTVQDGLEHGPQIKSIDKLNSEPWFMGTTSTVSPSGQWFIDDNGDLIVIARIPEPFTKYVKAYSQNCVAIRIDGKGFFYFLDHLTDDCRVNVLCGTRSFFEYTSPSISENENIKMESLSLKSQKSWTISMEKPHYLIVQSARHMLWVMLIITGACLVLVFVLSGIFSDFSVRRIHRLNKAMQVIQTGDFSLTVSDDSKDEIGVMTNNFQTMSEKISTLIKENYQSQITLKEAQLKALQAQINPHFLYNCLSLINSRALLTHQDDIGKMSQLMSTFYRTTLNKGKSDILIKDEIKNVLAYLEIQQLLHDKVFSVQTEIDPLLPDIRVPNLILQPLVENSIVHGILPKGKEGKLYLTVRRVENMLHFMVMDNGVGIPPEKIPTLTCTESNGYGLKNVNERLILTYGEQSALKINSIPNESTMIVFKIPID